MHTSASQFVALLVVACLLRLSCIDSIIHVHHAATLLSTCLISWLLCSPFALRYYTTKMSVHSSCSKKKKMMISNSRRRKTKTKTADDYVTQLPPAHCTEVYRHSEQATRCSPPSIYLERSLREHGCNSRNLKSRPQVNVTLFTYDDDVQQK